VLKFTVKFAHQRLITRLVINNSPIFLCIYREITAYQKLAAHRSSSQLIAARHCVTVTSRPLAPPRVSRVSLTRKTLTTTSALAKIPPLMSVIPSEEISMTNPLLPASQPTGLSDLLHVSQIVLLQARDLLFTSFVADEQLTYKSKLMPGSTIGTSLSSIGSCLVVTLRQPQGNIYAMRGTTSSCC